MSKRSLIPAATRKHAWGRRLSVAFLCAGLIAVIVAAVLGYPMVAALLVAALLAVFAVLRAILPGRPWFSSRNKPVDVLVLAGLAIAIAYTAQYASIPAA